MTLSPHPRPAARPTRGFSLLELLFALAVAALVVGFAIPGYQSYMRRSRRSDALDALYQLQQAQLRYRGFHAGYAKDLAELKTSFGAASRQGYYQLSTGIAGDAASGYFVQATAREGGAQAGDSECRQITLTQRQHTMSLTPPPCWGKR
jgi:type IV pilus assembly protein PilE